MSLDYADNICVGGMIEVPAAVLAADAFARELDFSLHRHKTTLCNILPAIDRPMMKSISRRLSCIHLF